MKRILTIISCCAQCLLIFIAGTVGLAAADTPDRPNVLMLAIDDLRPQLACYGRKQIESPHIDRLADRGVVFERAFCMVPTCGASRASLMTSIRPTFGRFVTHQARADKEAPGMAALNTHFKKHGYHAISNGKVFHYADDSAEGWSEPAWRAEGTPGDYQLEASHEAAMHSTKPKKRGPPYENAEAPDENYRDWQNATRAIEDLRRLKKMEKPFFLAVGFHKPHLPFCAPRKYWELYPEGEIALPENYFPPENAPEAAAHTFGELRSYAGVPEKGPVTREMALGMIRGYYACVSFVDAQVGRILDELENLDLAENTVILLWGDHGWQLGEHAAWCKHSCYETSMNAPLIVAAPGVTGGRKVRGMVEFIDIYPTLCDLAGLPVPGHVEGKSFRALMENPGGSGKDAVIGRFRNGDTIRTDRYRYTEYRDSAGEYLGRMLYDHRADPGENRNLSENPEYRVMADRLAGRLRAEVGPRDARYRD